MSKPLHTFDQVTHLCPNHGLSLDSEMLCFVCKLELEGKPTPNFSRHGINETGIKPGEDPQMFNSKAYRRKHKKAAKVEKTDETEVEEVEELEMVEFKEDSAVGNVDF